jgi:phosphoribosylamine--glycine ligase
MLKLMVIGSGAREHALAWKLAQSEKVEKVFAAPGNGGTVDEEKCGNVPLTGDPASEEGQRELLEFAKEQKIDVTLVGPEAPLAAGIVDRFRAGGLAVVGPDQKAARLEASKVYAKSFMEKYGVRTAKSRSFTDPARALAHAEEHFGKPSRASKKAGAAAPPLVIKADGLASGKGVVIAETLEDAKESLSSFMKKGDLGEAGKKVVIEEFIAGEEVSVLAAVSAGPGMKGVIKPFITARDHKSRFEGGAGPNTGGMGSIAPAPGFTQACQKDFEDAILKPTLKGIENEKMDYRGFIFFGLMVQENMCHLLEYNVRLGDPETQAVLPLLDSDLAALCGAILDGSLRSFSLKWKKGAVCAPVLAAEGYPGPYRKGDPIAFNPTGLARTGAKIFVAGAKKGGGGALGSGLRTSGGRVMTVSCLADTPEEARTSAYESLWFINFEGMAYRKDIGLSNSAGETNG